MQHFDVIIIGGGPGGTAAAKLLANAGRSVAVIEDSHLGGTCLNCGCVPTKLLLGAVAAKGAIAAQQRLRVAKGTYALDFTALQKRVKRFVGGSVQTLAKNLAALGVTVFNGRGEAVGPGRVLVHGTDAECELSGTEIILSGGSAPAAFPGLTPDHDCVLDSTDLLNSVTVPESLIVVGAGAIGVELGQFFAAAGSKVTIVEAAPHVAPLEDADIAAEFRRALVKAGITCVEGKKAVELVTKDGQASLSLEDGTVLNASKAMVAVGRRPNTAGLGAEALGCSLDRRGYVVTDAFLAAAEHVHAIGDINARVLLAHAAEHQAAFVARRILGRIPSGEAYVSGPVPSCYYGGTEIMRVGETAEALRRQGRDVAVSVAPLSANVIAQAHGANSGFAKVVWSDGIIAGIAAVGSDVSHLVTAAQLLMQGGYSDDRLYSVMFAHPTLDEILPLALRAERVPVK